MCQPTILLNAQTISPQVVSDVVVGRRPSRVVKVVKTENAHIDQALFAVKFSYIVHPPLQEMTTRNVGVVWRDMECSMPRLHDDSER